MCSQTFYVSFFSLLYATSLIIRVGLGLILILKMLRDSVAQMDRTSFCEAYHVGMMQPGTEIPINSKITIRWEQSFCNMHEILSRALSEILQLSATKGDFILKEFAFHSRVKSRASKPEYVYEENVENADESSFKINRDKESTLWSEEDEEVRLRRFF